MCSSSGQSGCAAMDSSSMETLIFTETNLGSRLAVPISPEATARDFKRVFERAHLNCFPKHGEIKVNGLMVQRKSFFYYLSDTVPLKHAFQYLKGIRFLQVKVCHFNIPDQLGSPEHVHEKIKDCSADGNDGARSKEPENFLMSTNKVKSKCWRRRIKRFSSLRISLLNIQRRFVFLKRQKSKRKRVRKKYGIKCSINAVDESNDIVMSEAKDKSSKEGNSGQTLSESMSVSGIIRKYFSGYDFSCYDEVNSKSGFAYSAVRGIDVCTTPPPYRAKLPPENVPLIDDSVSVASSKVKKAEVGKRLLTAANKLGLNASNRSPGLSLVRSLV